jgi:predicted NACHT family NTPase
LKSNKPIRELAITPILLSLTCLVFHHTGKFYSKRSQLYQEGLELLLEQWDKSREVERDEIYRDLSVERKLELLSYLAVKKFEQSQYVLFEQEELEQYIAEFLGIGQRDSRVVLRAIALQHGLLIERSRKVWSFSHLTFQEYLTARFFLACTNWVKLLDYILIPHWYNIFLLIVDILPNSDIFLTLAKEKIDSLTLSSFKLQKILCWSNQKSIAVEKTCTIAATKFHKKIAIRAFYIKLISNDIFKLTDCLEIAQCITEKMSISKDIAYGLALDFGKTHTLDFSLDLTLWKILDRAMHNNLDIIYYLKTCRSIISEIQYQYQKLPEEVLIAMLNRTLENLNEGLEKLIQELSNHERRIEGWWNLNGKRWTHEFRKLIILNRNIGHNLYLDDNQKRLVQQYYTGNKLLIDCLKSDCVVSKDVRCKIEQTLLLPIAEIEKRKQENVD